MCYILILILCWHISRKIEYRTKQTQTRQKGVTNLETMVGVLPLGLKTYAPDAYDIFFCFTLDLSIWDQNSFCWEKFGFLVKPVNPWHRQCLNYTKENLVEFASPPEAYFITSTLHSRTNNFFCVQRNCNVTELIFRITLKGKFNISFVMKGLRYI